MARDIAADVHNNIQKWNGYHIKGASIVKDIAGILSGQPRKLTSDVERLTIELRSIVDNLQIFSKAMSFLGNQMTALVNLHRNGTPLFISLTVEQLADIVNRISLAYKGELKVRLLFFPNVYLWFLILQRKEYILENIAFSRDKHELMFHASCWTYQEYIEKYQVQQKLEILLVETGHRKIT